MKIHRKSMNRRQNYQFCDGRWYHCCLNSYDILSQTLAIYGYLINVRRLVEIVVFDGMVLVPNNMTLVVVTTHRTTCTNGATSAVDIVFGLDVVLVVVWKLSVVVVVKIGTPCNYQCCDYKSGSSLAASPLFDSSADVSSKDNSAAVSGLVVVVIFVMAWQFWTVPWPFVLLIHIILRSRIRHMGLRPKNTRLHGVPVQDEGGFDDVRYPEAGLSAADSKTLQYRYLKLLTSLSLWPDERASSIDFVRLLRFELWFVGRVHSVVPLERSISKLSA